MRLAIYNRGIPFDGATPFVHPLGGSETSVVHMARELARCGHDVIVYANTQQSRCERPPAASRPSPFVRGTIKPVSPLQRGRAAARSARPKAAASGEGGRGSLTHERRFDGVRYRHCHDFFQDYASSPWDVLISFRSFDPFLLGRIAPRMIFWTGDAHDQPALQHFEHPALQQNIDRVFCVSKWQRDSFMQAFDLPPGKIIQTRNGFSPELIPQPADRDWTRCAYSSTPFRGLNVLLQMFPHLRQRIPTLRLDVFSSMQVYGWSREADQQTFGATYQAAGQPGVTWHGSVPQPRLMEHLARCGLFLYPNTFAETSCMAAIEAQACGAVVITTDRAALAETVEHGKTGICLYGEPATNEYQREFIITVSQLLAAPSRLQELSNAARERANRIYRWSTVASEWTAIFESMPATRVHARHHGPLTLLQKTQDYLQNGNVSAASRVLAALDETPFFKTEVDALKGRISTWM